MTQLDGKTALITGSTDGVGTRGWLMYSPAAGARVLVHGRDRHRGQRVIAEITEAGGAAEFLAAELASLAEVRRLADTVRRERNPARHPHQQCRHRHRGHFTPVQRRRTRVAFRGQLPCRLPALTHLLLPLILNSAPARIVNVASAGQQALDFDDIMLYARLQRAARLLPEQAGADHVHHRPGTGTRRVRRRRHRAAPGNLHGDNHGPPRRGHAAEHCRARRRGDPQSRRVTGASKDAAGAISTACARHGPTPRHMTKWRASVSRQSAWN